MLLERHVLPFIKGYCLWKYGKSGIYKWSTTKIQFTFCLVPYLALRSLYSVGWWREHRPWCQTNPVFNSLSPSLSIRCHAPALNISEIPSLLFTGTTTALVYVFIIFLWNYFLVPLKWFLPWYTPWIDTPIVCSKWNNLSKAVWLKRPQKNEQFSGHDEVRSSCQNGNQLYHYACYLVQLTFFLIASHSLWKKWSVDVHPDLSLLHHHRSPLGIDGSQKAQVPSTMRKPL